MVGMVAAMLPVAAGCGGSSAASSPAASASTTPVPAVTITTGHVAGLGTVLVDGQRHTVYAFLPDAHHQVSCVGACASIWAPVYVANGQKPAAAGQVKASLLGSDRNPTGSGRVVTYAGWPLYTYAGDPSAGQATGQAKDLNGGFWYVLSPEGSLVHKQPQ
jgi:predicted lipoprotein with Yx(FWY)xxD motif